MPLTPLDRVVHLKKTLELTFGENYIKNTDFYKALDELLKKMHAIPANELVGEKISESDFIKSLLLNRADTHKLRFVNDGSLTNHACLEDQISRLTKIFIEQLEDRNLDQPELDNLKKSKLHQILYRNAVLTGRYEYDNESSTLLGRLYLQRALIGLFWATLAVSFYASVAILGLNGVWLIAATSLLSAASTYASLLVFGVMNGYFTAKLNLPYYLLGEERLENSYFYSNDPLVQGIGLGVVRTHRYASIAAALFGLSTFITMIFSLNAVITFDLAVLLTIVPLFTLALNAYTNYNAEKYKTEGYPLDALSGEEANDLRAAISSLNPNTKHLDLDKIDFDSPELSKYLRKNAKLFSTYQLNGLSLMSSSKKDKADWIANRDRSAIGFLGAMIINGITLLRVFSVEGAFLSGYTSFLFATTLPLISVSLSLVGLSFSIGYAYVNQDEQPDNRYKLFTRPRSQRICQDKLYVSEEEVRAEMEGERWELASH